MELSGLLNNLIRGASDIDLGRKGFTVTGDEYNGHINYDRGISLALAAFQDAKIIADPQTFILTELVFLQQELQFCNEVDTNAQSSLTQAIQSFDDALRAFKADQDSTMYKGVELACPQDRKFRYHSMPKDAYHIACIAHRTRLQNILRVPGMNMTEKVVYQQRFDNMKTAQDSYVALQEKALG
jgi:hypothetical protein